MASRFKSLKRVAESRGQLRSPSQESSQRRGKTLAEKTAPSTGVVIRVPAGRTQMPVERPGPQPKRKAPAVEPQETKRRATAVEKGKRVAGEHPTPFSVDDLPELNREERNNLYQLPEFSEPRFLDVSNATSIFDEPTSMDTWKAFQGGLFEKDQAFLADQRFSVLARMGAYHSLALANIFYQSTLRSVIDGQRVREWREKYEELAGSASREKVEELEEQLAIANSKVSELSGRLKSAEESAKRADADLMAAVSDKSELEARIEQLRVDAIEARKIGETHSREAVGREKDAEFQSVIPTIRRQAVEDFARGPVFKSANLLLSANDFTTGWNRAVGQIRLQGVAFDESKLDMSLDEFGRSWDDDDDEAEPEVEGNEFAVLMPLFDEMAKESAEKIAAAAARAAEKAIISASDQVGAVEAPSLAPEIEVFTSPTIDPTSPSSPHIEAQRPPVTPPDEN